MSGPTYLPEYRSINMLLNPLAEHWQRQVATTETIYNDKAYCADRWFILAESDASANQAAGPTNAVSSFEITQHNVSAERNGLGQVVESVHATRARGKPVRLDVDVLANFGSATIVAIVLEWTGTADAPTDPVNSWASTDYSTGNFITSSNYTVVGVTEHALSGADTWERVSVVGNVSTSCNNLMVLIVTNGDVSQNNYIRVAAPDFYIREHVEFDTDMMSVYRYCNGYSLPTLDTWFKYFAITSTTQGQLVDQVHPMRTTPSLNLTASQFETFSGTGSIGTTVSFGSITTNEDNSIIYLPVNSSGLTDGEIGLLRNDTAGARFYYDAEIEVS